MAKSSTERPVGSTIGLMTSDCPSAPPRIPIGSTVHPRMVCKSLHASVVEQPTRFTGSKSEQEQNFESLITAVYQANFEGDDRNDPTIEPVRDWLSTCGATRHGQCSGQGDSGKRNYSRGGFALAMCCALFCDWLVPLFCHWLVTILY